MSSDEEIEICFEGHCEKKKKSQTKKLNPLKTEDQQLVSSDDDSDVISSSSSISETTDEEGGLGVEDEEYDASDFYRDYLTDIGILALDTQSISYENDSPSIRQVISGYDFINASKGYRKLSTNNESSGATSIITLKLDNGYVYHYHGEEGFEFAALSKGQRYVVIMNDDNHPNVITEEFEYTNTHNFGPNITKLNPIKSPNFLDLFGEVYVDFCADEYH